MVEKENYERFDSERKYYGAKYSELRITLGDDQMEKKSHIYTILLTTYLRFEESYCIWIVIITFPWSIFITLFPVFHRRVCTWMGKETLVVWKLNGRWVIDTGVSFHIIYLIGESILQEEKGVGLIYTARTVV